MHIHGPVKVTMVGGDASGKTTYMCGMYGVMKDGVEGVTLAADEYDDERLTTAWAHLEGRGIFPPCTCMGREYRFRVNLHGQWLTDLTVHDNRGGALFDSAEDRSETADLLRHVEESDCLFVFIPGNELAAYCKRQETRDLGKIIRRVNHLCALASHHRALQVAILITKADLFEGVVSLKEATEKIRTELLSPLFAAGSQALVMICPIVFRSEVINGGSCVKAHAMGVHLPVVFAAYASLNQRLMDSRADRLISAVSPRAAHPQDVARLRLDVKAEDSKVRGKMDGLKMVLEGASSSYVIYFNGTAVDFG